MSRAWLKVEGSLWRHPKVIQLAKLYDVEPYLVCGFLLAWWEYCTDFAASGASVECPLDVLTGFAQPIMRQTRKTTVPAIRDALITCRLMDETGAPHDWQDYSGALVSKRAKDAQRKKVDRAVSKGLSDGRPHLEKRREENKRQGFEQNVPQRVGNLLREPRSIP